MKATIQVLAQGRRRSFKEGKFVMHECQCVVLGDDLEIGVWKISERVCKPILKPGVCPVVTDKGEPVLDESGRQKMEPHDVILPGAYELEYGLGVDWQTKEFGGVVKTVTAVGKGNAMLASLSQSAAAPDANKPKAG